MDTSLVGVDQGELITLPSLPDDSDWERMESARKTLNRTLFSTVPGCSLWTGSGCNVAGMIGSFTDATEKSLSFCKNDSFLRAVALAVSYPLN